MFEYIFSSKSIGIQSNRSFHPNEQTLLSEGLWLFIRRESLFIDIVDLSEPLWIAPFENASMQPPTTLNPWKRA